MYIFVHLPLYFDIFHRNFHTTKSCFSQIKWLLKHLRVWCIESDTHHLTKNTPSKEENKMREISMHYAWIMAQIDERNPNFFSKWLSFHTKEESTIKNPSFKVFLHD